MRRARPKSSRIEYPDRDTDSHKSRDPSARTRVPDRHANSGPTRQERMALSVMPPSLCPRCRWVRAIRSARGSEFWLCERSLTDRRFAKYPPQPVTQCLGFEPADAIPLVDPTTRPSAGSGLAGDRELLPARHPAANREESRRSEHEDESERGKRRDSPAPDQ